MKKRLCILGILSVLILLTGCIDSLTVIAIRKDGSGTLTETIYVDQSVKAMMEGMAAQMGAEDDEDKEGKEEPIDVKKYMEKATKMGEGVEFVSAKEVTREDGAVGTKIKYSFKDIRKLNFKVQPDNPIADDMAGMVDAEESEEDEDDPIRFDFIEGKNPTLVIHIPREDESEESEEDTDEAEEEDSETDASGLGMMRMFMQGFRIRVLVRPLESEIKETNATFVKSKDGKQVVTLFDVKLGEILTNEKYQSDFKELEKIKDMNAALEKMKDIPGLMIETKDRVEITLK